MLEVYIMTYSTNLLVTWFGFSDESAEYRHLGILQSYLLSKDSAFAAASSRKWYICMSGAVKSD